MLIITRRAGEKIRVSNDHLHRGDRGHPARPCALASPHPGPSPCYREEIWAAVQAGERRGRRRPPRRAPRRARPRRASNFPQQDLIQGKGIPPMSLRINSKRGRPSRPTVIYPQTSDAISKSMERLSVWPPHQQGGRTTQLVLASPRRCAGQIRGLAQAQRNIQERACSMVQTAEGNLDEVHSILQRIRELAVEYRNGSLSTAGKGRHPVRGRPAVGRDHAPFGKRRRVSTASAS